MNRPRNMLYVTGVLIASLLTVGARNVYRDQEHAHKVHVLQVEARALVRLTDMLVQVGAAKEAEVQQLRAEIADLLRQHDADWQRIVELEKRVADLLAAANKDKATINDLQRQLRKITKERDEALKALESKPAPHVKDILNGMGDAANRPPSAGTQP